LGGTLAGKGSVGLAEKVSAALAAGSLILEVYLKEERRA